ncbi:hypothetical protein A2961_00040 [Candidatus Woesebacteria bacterium RIFCSPLOWO2_01_FULL_39_21]|uniref:Uncharacterized protein n=1 Tax=Candidatus Woesebacteria bacterium RIFCSPLOWO2_01_FULL_39_21 TaxID=1802519 RepID=A0A1F8BIG6_9BACT|nr:MAG: hypothetical protein A2691_00285 [Candidatus Woesebacteria bacterium RIFCSPHIGHO2_01_FULL_39_23]OGM63854.1 MAG: hypothetical protein A2961_00040 [Candidatus Woesebacteria bacterium RIFCSPLOWO2_01_FULL_39_21]
MNLLLYLSLLVLIFANAVPILGVVILGWDIKTLAAIYWFEAGIQGFFAIIRIFKSEGPLSRKAFLKDRIFTSLIKLPIIPFFATNYFIFLVVYGILLYLIIGIENLEFIPILYMILVFFISHLISFYVNFIKRMEFKKESPIKQIFEPYRRYGLTHLAVFMGVIAAKYSEFPQNWVLITALVKTILDASLHIKEHKRGVS